MNKKNKIYNGYTQIKQLFVLFKLLNLFKNVLFKHKQYIIFIWIILIIG